MSIGSILSTARTALLAQQAGVQTVSHNIANAATDGYSRQRAEMSANYPQTLPNGTFGTGVSVHDISRIRDSLLDRTFREASSESGAFRRRYEMLSQVEGLFLEPSEHGLGASLDAFFSAWGDLANNPTSHSARAVLRDSAVRLTDQFQRLSVGLEQVAASTLTRMQEEVAEVNRLTAEVAQLNSRILSSEAGGSTAGDLRDARDRALDRIASIVPVQVMARQDGTVGVAVNGAMIVDAGQSVDLSLTSQGGTWRLATARGIDLPITSGAIGGALTVLNRDLPDARAQLDLLAQGIAREINDIHRQGTAPSGATGINIFAMNPVLDGDGNVTGWDHASINASNFAVSAAVLANTNAIAAGTGGVDANGDPVYRSGAVDIASRIAALRDESAQHLGGRSFAQFYNGSVTRVGLAVRSAGDSATVHETLGSQADLRRNSISGVSIDEEMVSLIRYQNAYAAAARLVSVADEMLQTVIGMAR